jgi:hypothetical protein
VLGAIERCRCFQVAKNPQTGYLRLQWRQGQCEHCYVYFIDEEFGLCHLRILTWAPFRLQFCCNGHDWLERQMKPAGIRYKKADNCFPHCRDFGALHSAENYGLLPDLRLPVACPLSRWFKPASAAKRYPAGWPGGIGVDLLGSRYDPTLELPGLLPVATAGNATLDLSGAGLTDSGLTSFLNLRPLDKVAAVPPNTAKLSLTIARSTGLIKGSILAPGTTRRLPLHVVMFQKQALIQKQPLGQGFFLDTAASGAVILAPVAGPAAQ